MHPMIRVDGADSPGIGSDLMSMNLVEYGSVDIVFLLTPSSQVVRCALVSSVPKRHLGQRGIE